MEITNETGNNRIKANIACTGGMFEDMEMEKWKQKTSKHTNDQLGWSPTFSLDEACKGKHRLSAEQEARDLDPGSSFLYYWKSR